MSLYRAEKLIDLACSSTHEEEARTAALTACRLIRRHGFRLTTQAASAWESDASQHRARPSPQARPSAPEPALEKPPNGGTWSKAVRSGRCESCGGAYAYGDDVYSVLGATWCARH